MRYRTTLLVLALASVAIVFPRVGSAQYEVYVNAGGDDYTDAFGTLFVADQPYLTGSFGYLGGSTIADTDDVLGTSDDELYQSVHYGSEFGYLFDGVPPGNYVVTLFFNEVSRTADGKRAFDVLIEDTIVLDDFDIHAAAGGVHRAHRSVIPVSVDDGRLEIEFRAVVARNATVSAIAVTPESPFAIRVNCGGGDYVDARGNLFVADREFIAGSFGFIGGGMTSDVDDVAGTEDDALYQSVHYGSGFGYLFDGVPTGNYLVSLYFNEVARTSNGERTFDTLVEDVLVLDDFDIYRYAASPGGKSGGGTDRAYREIIETTVTDGQLKIEFDAVVSQNAIVSAIEVVPKPATPLAAFSDVSVDTAVVFDNLREPSECDPPAGTGSAWSDYDGDGDLDLYVTNHGGPNRLFRNDGDSNNDGLPEFTDDASAAGVDDAGIGHAAVFVDYDNDGDQDLYVTNWGGNVFFQNQLVEGGTAVFIDVTAEAGLADAGRAISAAWGDFDSDGRLDLYLAKHFTCMPTIQESADRLFRSNVDGTFTDVTDWLCPEGPAPCPQISGFGFTAGWLDYDNDADLDLYLVNDDIRGENTANVLWRNDGSDLAGGWIFTDVSVESGADKSVNGMGLGVGDYDNDGFLDLAFSNIAANNLLRNRGDGTFEETSALAGIQRGYIRDIDDVLGSAQWTWGTTFIDHDNDGWLDLFFVAGYLFDDRPLMPHAFFGNQSDGTFVDLTVVSGLGTPGRARNASTVDFDGDGFVDLFVAGIPDTPNSETGPGPHKSNGTARLYHNESLGLGNPNGWLVVTVEGTVSNRDAIGTRLTLTTPDGQSQIREISSGPTHGGGDHRAAYFGLGPNATGELTIRWPSGAVTEIGTVSANQLLHYVE